MRYCSTDGRYFSLAHSFCHARLGFASCFFGFCNIDCIAPNCHIGQHSNISWCDLDKSLAYNQVIIAACLVRNYFAWNNLRDQRHMVGVNPELPFNARQGHHLDLVGKGDFIRRDDLESEHGCHIELNL